MKEIKQLKIKEEDVIQLLQYYLLLSFLFGNEDVKDKPIKLRRSEIEKSEFKKYIKDNRYISPFGSYLTLDIIED